MAKSKTDTSAGTNTLAIIALICSFIFPPAGLILGIISLVQINKNPNQSGKGLAVAAIVLSSVFMLLAILFTFFILAFSIGLFSVLSSQLAAGTVSGPEVSSCILPTTSISCIGPDIDTQYDKLYFGLASTTEEAYVINSLLAVPSAGNPATGTCIAVEKDEIGYIWNVMYIPVYGNGDFTLTCPEGSLSSLVSGQYYDWDLILETYPENSDVSTATTSYGTLRIVMPYPATG
jgi:hypothetical protein